MTNIDRPILCHVLACSTHACRALFTCDLWTSVRGSPKIGRIVLVKFHVVSDVFLGLAFDHDFEYLLLLHHQGHCSTTDQYLSKLESCGLRQTRSCSLHGRLQPMNPKLTVSLLGQMRHSRKSSWGRPTRQFASMSLYVSKIPECSNAS